ncbi:MAG: NERD domain-containing protein [Parasporobacterium sp.]|nr:NERD domain-containing protein [Parasporobacterium sp.]
MSGYLIAALIVLFVGILIAVLLLRKRSVPPHKAAGNAGEEAAAAVIKRILQKRDYCGRNVPVSFGGQKTELDFVIVNRNGVFIIEVKNYSGKISGEEEALQWKKSKTSQGGKTYEKFIENPIPQVKREEYILGNFLRSKGINVWVNGYIYFVRNNRPFQSRYLLNSGNEIDMAIHKKPDSLLNEKTIEHIVKTLHL